MLEVGKRPQKGTDSGKQEATPDWRLGLTPFPQVLVQIPNQAEGNQVRRATGTTTALVFLPQRGLKLSPQVAGQLLWLQLPAGVQSAKQPLASYQERRHAQLTLQSGDPDRDFRPPNAGRRRELAGGERRGRGPRGRDAARGSVGRGRNPRATGRALYQ